MERKSLFDRFRKKEDKKIQVLRPPYYNSEDDFKNCIECETKDCKIACDEDVAIIQIQEDGTPTLNFAFNGCTFCDDCASACKDDVLQIDNKKNINAIFSIDIIKCMSWHNTMCFSCKDPCLDNAIEFLGMFRPEIKTDICTGCGFCLKVCPADAIELKIKS